MMMKKYQHFHSRGYSFQRVMWAMGVWMLSMMSASAQVDLTAPGALYSQNFDAATDFTSIQWTSFDVDGDGVACGGNGTGKWEVRDIPCNIQNPANVARGGVGKAAVYGYLGTAAGNDWIFSPALSLAANKPYKIIYYYRNASPSLPEKMQAMITSGNTPATAENGVPASAPLKDYPNMINAAYTKDSIMFTPSAAGTFYFAVKALSTQDQFFIALDDVSVQNLEVPQNDLAVTSITTAATVASCATYTANTEFTVKVKNTGVLAQTNFNVEWSIKRGTTTVASNTQNIASLASGAETTFVVAGDLTIGGTYVVTAKTILANDGIPSNDQFTLSRFNPLSDLSAQGANYLQPFNSLGTVGWVADPVATTTSGWKLVNLGTTAAPQGALLGQRKTSAASNDWIYTNCFNLVTGQKYRITYQRAKLNTNAATPTSDEKIALYVGASAASAAMTTQIGATGEETVSNATFATITFDYTATATGVQYFAFKQTSAALPAGYPTTAIGGIVIDNFQVLAVPNTDLSLKSLSPTFTTLDPCSGYTNAVALTLKVINAGSQDINTQDFVFKYRVKNSAGTIIQNEATLASGNVTLTPNAEANLAATTAIDMSQNRYYLVEVYSSSANDPNKLNDTLKYEYRNGARDLTANGAMYEENFDAANTVDMPWAFLDAANTANSGEIAYNTTAGFASSAPRFLAGFSGTDATNAWASSGCLRLEAGKLYTVEFKYRTTAFAEKLKLVLLNTALPTTAGTAVSANTIAVTIKDYPSLTNATNAHVSSGALTFTVPNTGYYYLAFNQYSGANPNAATTQSFVVIDDVKLQQVVIPTATGLTATASTSQKQIALSWTASTSNLVTGYRIERSTTTGSGFAQIGTTTTQTTYNDTDANLALNTPYFYRVIAVVNTVAAAPSNEASATIVATAPAAPTALTATASTTQKQIALSWTASANTSSYKIERSTTTGTGFTQIGTSATASYTDSDAALAFNTTYFYRVKAVNGFDLTSDASNEASASVVNIAPNAPVLASVVNASAGLKNTITWNAVSGAASYRLERSETGATGTFTTVYTGTALTYDDNTVQYQKTYHYRVFALNAFSTASAASNVLSATVTAIENAQLSASVKLYPNPTKASKINVEMPEVQKAVTFVVTDAMGKEVFRTVGENEKNFSIKATNLARGLYYLHISTAKGLAVKKVVIE